MNELRAIIKLVEDADMVMLCHGVKKAALGRDVQEAIVSAMKIAAEVEEVLREEEEDEEAPDPPRSAA